MPDLYGTYEVVLPSNATEHLTLRENGECDQVIRLANGDELIAHGHWRFSEKLNYLFLYGTRISLDPTGRLRKNLGEVFHENSGALPVSRAFDGNVTITLGESFYYKKVK